MSDTVFNIFGEQRNIIKQQKHPINNIAKLQSVKNQSPAIHKKKSFLQNNVSSLQFSVTKKGTNQLFAYEDPPINVDPSENEIDEIEFAHKHYVEEDEYFSDQDPVSDELMDKLVFGLPDDDYALPDFPESKQYLMDTPSLHDSLKAQDYDDDELPVPMFDSFEMDTPIFDDIDFNLDC